MSYPTYSTNNGVGITDPTGDIQIGVGINGLILTTGLLTTPTTTTINPSGFTTGANNFPFNALYQLNQALQALEPAPSSTVVQFNNTILLQDPLVPTDALGLTPTSISSLSNLDLLTDPTTGTNITLNSTGGIGTINFDGANVNSFGYATPICFSRPRTDTFTYSFGGQNFENVYTTNCQIPQQFISNNPLPSYTSTYWKIEFALNCYQFSNTTDKGMGLYIEFVDSASNVYTPFAYNSNTPYSADQKNFGYTNNGNQPFISFNWTDYVDFAGLVNTATANFPLEVKLYFAADSGLSTQFNMLITLTRTNMI